MNDDDYKPVRANVHGRILFVEYARFAGDVCEHVSYTANKKAAAEFGARHRKLIRKLLAAAGHNSPKQKPLHAEA